jgi:AcrR family transcriptional regulator
MTAPTMARKKRARSRSYSMEGRAEAVNATRERITETTLRLLLEQPYEDITLVAIARAARVSHQTVLNHFDSKEGVAAAAAELLARQTVAARDRATPGDVDGAIAVLVGEYERIGDANARWAIASERLGSLAPLLDDARTGHQAWLQYIFSDSLPSTEPARRRTIHALHAATDVYTWKLLRRDLRLSRGETEQIVADLVHAILAASSVSGKQHGRPRRRPG